MNDTTYSDVPKSPKIDREIATIGEGRDITRGYLGPLLIPQDRLLNYRGDDLRVYENVLSEPQVASVLQQRRLAITQCEWRVDPASEARVDKKAADFLRTQLERVGWDRVTGLMHYGVFYGYAVSEVIYGRDGSQVTLEAIKVRNRRRFRFDKNAGLRLLTYANMIPGEPCESPYFWHYATGADNDDEPYGLGLAHWLYWLAIFKRNGLKFWLTFLEKFGQPTAVGTYDQAATPAERAALLQAALAVQTDSGIILPKGMELVLLEAARSGAADYEKFNNTMDDMIAKVVIGQSMTSEVRGGQYKSEMQHDVRQDLVKADADLICESFNLTVARWLTAWNFPAAQPPRVYRVVEEPEDLNTLAKRDQEIAQMGFKPTLKYVTDTYGGEWEEAAPPPAAPPGIPGTPGVPAIPGAVPAVGVKTLVQAAPAFAQPGDPVDAAVVMTPGLDAAADPALTGWINRFRALVDKAQNLDELRDQVFAVMPDMTLEQYTTAMQQALAAAALAGRYELLQEAGGG
ncbi:MAG: DUF935 domain-containing protein [Rhodanobacter sp.]